MTELKCNCGRQVRYSHFKDGVEVMSCNKHITCPTYEDQRERLSEIEIKYNQLLRAVCSKYPSETRHETALRYINAMESMTPLTSP